MTKKRLRAGSLGVDRGASSPPQRPTGGVSAPATKSAHTPGPWENPGPVDTWVRTVGDPYGHGPMHIADVRGWGHLTGQGACALPDAKAIAIQTANGNLIAAAPDLLKALTAASHALRSYQYGNAAADLARDIADVADAAIAKAEGR